MAAIITVTARLYLRIYWVSAKTGFDKRRRWSQSFPLPNFSVKVLVVEAGDFPYIFPDYSKYTPLYMYRIAILIAVAVLHQNSGCVNAECWIE